MTRDTGPARRMALGLVLGVLAVTGTAAGQGAPPGAAPSAPAPAAAPSQPPAIAPMDESRRVQADDIDKLLADGKTLLLDVREPKELLELGTLPDAINIPLGQLEKRMGELPKDRVILTA